MSVLRTGKYTKRFSNEKIRKSSTADLKSRFCLKPFSHFEITLSGLVYLCCPSWLPESIGSLSTASFNDIWISEKAQKIRQSILDGSFKYCSKTNCPFISSNSLPLLKDTSQATQQGLISSTLHEITPITYMLCYDHSCNLSCPSCRVKTVLHSPTSDAYSDIQRIDKKIFDHLFCTPTDRAFRVDITGTGDPFASFTFMHFLKKIPPKGYPNFSIRLQTNGVLLDEKTWSQISNVHGYVREISVSVDAASEEVYDSIRRGGNWKRLISNLKFLISIKNKYSFSLSLNFVVQQKNYFQMHDFILLAKSLGVKKVQFFLLTDWGTWENYSDYHQQCVWSETHPEHENFINHISSPIFDDPIVLPSDIQLYRSNALTAPPN